MLQNPLPARLPAVDTAAVADLPRVALTIDARAAVESQAGLTRFQNQVGDILSRSLPLSVAITGLEELDAASVVFAQVCSCIAACAVRLGTQPGDIEIVIAAHAMSPLTAWKARCESLERGPLYLVAGEHDLRMVSGDHARFQEFWQELWQLRSEQHLRLACAPLVRSHCPLLAHEIGATVLPQAAVQVPTGSAWICQLIELRRFANASGVLDRERLRSELQRCIDQGLAAHAHTDWPTASLRHDSWLNRRLAINLTGIGDLVQRRRQDPRQIACLATLRKTLRWIRMTLTEYSARVALSDELLPAIAQFDPVWSLRSDRDQWQARWSAAIKEHARACRNLVVMSPWSVFPTTNDPDPAYMNLLPLLDFADACAFPRSPRLASWNSKDFMQLYQRTWAVLERRNGAQWFAEQV